MLFDVVYPLKRQGAGFNELRYSLRSLSQLPHRKAVVVGGKPDWYMGYHIPAPPQLFNRYQDSSRNISLAVMSELVSDPFWLFNDDFFVLSSEVPRYQHRGDLREWLLAAPNTVYSRSKKPVLELLNDMGFDHPRAFNLHTPLLIHKDAAREALELLPRTQFAGFRTVYGNLAGLPATYAQDVKVRYNRESIFKFQSPTVSTSDEAFRVGKAGSELRLMLDRPSPYERC